MYVEYQFISKLAKSENIVYDIPLYNDPRCQYVAVAIHLDNGTTGHYLHNNATCGQL